MLTRELYDRLCGIIPPSLSCKWDNDGLFILPFAAHESKKILFALDVTFDTVKYAAENGFDTLITHHPMNFKPLPMLDGGTPTSEKALMLIRADIAAMSFHTRFDAVEGGVNDVLASVIGLSDTMPFGSEGEEIGRLGTIKETDFDSFCKSMIKTFGSAHFSANKCKDSIAKVAVCGGAAGDMILPAAEAGADVLLCGELKYHELLDARELGLSVVCAGHYETEAPAMEALMRTVLTLGDFEAVNYETSRADLHK